MREKKFTGYIYGDDVDEQLFPWFEWIDLKARKNLKYLRTTSLFLRNGMENDTDIFVEVIVKMHAKNKFVRRLSNRIRNAIKHFGNKLSKI